MKIRIFFIVSLLFFSAAHSIDLGKGRPFDILHVHVAPDPVNVRNGNFYLPLPDYYQSCFGFPLEVYRSYNSFSTRDGPFGHGWTFNYDVQIIVGEKKGLQVVEPDGFINQYIPVEIAQENQATTIQKIVAARKAEDAKYMKKKDGKGADFYKDLEQKLRKDPELFKHQRDRYVGNSSQGSTSGKYVSYSRGTTYLEKNADGYTRTTESGQTEKYNSDGYLIEISDRNDNWLKFFYQKNKLTKVTDICGDFLDISYQSGDKISKIDDSLGRQMTYDYDKDLNLISNTGIDKQTISYTYDKFKRMNTILFKSDGTKTVITYDDKTGVVTAQQGPGTKITTYEYGKEGPKIWTRIKDNEGQNILYEYIDSENKIIQTDTSIIDPEKILGNARPIPSQHIVTTTVLSTCCGKPVLIENSQGVHDTLEYDSDGNLSSKTDSKGDKVYFDYEPRFKRVSEIRDSSGEITRYRYEQKGNLSFAKKIEADGTSFYIKMTYEPHGMLDSIIDSNDQEIRFLYSAIAKPTSISLFKSKKKLAEIQMQYSKDGKMENLQYIPNNPETAEMIRSTLKSYLLLLKPAGIDFEI